MRRISALLFALLLPAVAAAHGGMREIRGTIQKVDTDSVIVKRVDGNIEAVQLTPSTTYHMRLVSRNLNGASVTPDRVFTTPAT